MKRSIIIFLVLVFLGISFSSESPLPVIKDGKYSIDYRKGKTFFVDLVYEVEIQGKSKSYDGWLKVILYNEKGEEIDSFGRQIKIKPKELQKFGGSQMIMIKVVKEIKQVGFDLGVYQKKY